MWKERGNLFIHFRSELSIFVFHFWIYKLISGTKYRENNSISPFDYNTPVTNMDSNFLDRFSVSFSILALIIFA